MARGLRSVTLGAFLMSLSHPWRTLETSVFGPPLILPVKALSTVIK